MSPGKDSNLLEGTSQKEAFVRYPRSLKRSLRVIVHAAQAHIKLVFLVNPLRVLKPVTCGLDVGIGVFRSIHAVATVKRNAAPTAMVICYWLVDACGALSVMVSKKAY